MNLLSGVPVTSTDPPVWPDLDIFNLTNISSPPSWVSGTDSPIPHTEETFTSQSATHQHLFDDVNRPSASLSDYSKYPIPEGNDIVDPAFDFHAPPSPVLSDIPLTPHPISAPPSVLSVQSSLLAGPFDLPQPTVPHPNLPAILSVSPLPAMSELLIKSCNADSCSVSSQRKPSPALPPPAPPTPLPLRKVHPTLTTTPIPTGRVQKQTRRYTVPKSSRYCHLCARHQRSVSMIPCGNVELGLCQKSVCGKCIEHYRLQVTLPSWSCPHCQNKCPQRAKCFAYDRQTARRRERTLRAKRNSHTPATPVSIQQSKR